MSFHVQLEINRKGTPEMSNLCLGTTYDNLGGGEAKGQNSKTVKSSKQLSLEAAFVQMHLYPRAYGLLTCSYADKESCKKDFCVPGHFKQG